MTEQNEMNANEVLEVINEWFGLSDYETVIKEVENGTKNANFGDYKQVPILSESKFGRIGLREFFEDNGYGNGEMLSVEQVKEELDGHEWTEKSHDNTYNYGGFIETNMDFKTIENEEETTIVFYAIHIGLDVRAGYTESFAIKYDTYYDSMDILTERFPLAYLEFESDGKTYGISIDGEICNEYASVYISDNEGNEYPSFYESETMDIDLYSASDCLESVTEYLKENEIAFDENSLKIVK